MKAQAVHLDEHLNGEEHDEEEVGHLLEVVQPRGLPVMLRGQDARVEEHQDDDDPEHGLGLDGLSTDPAGAAVELLRGLLLLLPPGVGLLERLLALVPAGAALAVRRQFGCNSN